MSPRDTIRSTFCCSATRNTSVRASKFEWMSEMMATRMNRTQHPQADGSIQAIGESGREQMGKNIPGRLVQAEVCSLLSKPAHRRENCADRHHRLARSRLHHELSGLLQGSHFGGQGPRAERQLPGGLDEA